MSKNIDALIAEHIMEGDIRPYSTVVQAAWSVVAGIVETDDSWEFSLNSMWACGQDKIYSAHFYDSSNTLMNRREFADGAAWDGNIAMAICLAALKSKGVDYDQQD